MTAPEQPSHEPAQDAGEDTGSTEQDAARAGGDLSREDLEKALAKTRDEAARYRQRAKLAADDEWYARAQEAVKAIDEAEQAKRSEVEKVTEEKEKLASRASSAEQQLLRLRVALSTGVDPQQVDEFASRLRGDDEDQLKADAEVLIRYFRPTQEETPRRGDPSQGVGADIAGSPGAALQALLRNA